MTTLPLTSVYATWTIARMCVMDILEAPDVTTKRAIILEAKTFGKPFMTILDVLLCQAARDQLRLRSMRN